MEDLVAPEKNSFADGPFGSNLKTEHYTLEPEVRIIQLSNIGESGWRNGNKKYTTFTHAETISRSKVSPGDIVIAKMMPAGRAVEVPDIDKSYVLSSDAIKFVPSTQMDKQFLLFAINSSLVNMQILAEVQGIGRVRTSLGKMKKYYMPIPPIFEQRRIVATIESSFAIIDEIERNKTDLRSAVDVAKKRILSLAICGKLVPQDPNDEPASVLLERIRTELDTLIKAGKIKRNKNEFTIIRSSDNSYYTKLPDGWVWARLADVVTMVMGQSPSGDSVSDNSIGVEFHQGKLFFSDRYLAHSGQYTSAGNKIADKDSVLLCVRAPVGIVNITKREIAIGRGLCALSPLGGMSVVFLFHWLTAVQSDFIAQATGTTFIAITTDVVRQQLIPIPPLTEQQRIMVTIEAAFEQIDNIVTQLI
ncbi:MAG: restriction endonuclease subunit S [Nitrososphaerota archaeon]|nr:restriction endonuclease subunit S [Nitrososphaerota archaeon]